MHSQRRETTKQGHELKGEDRSKVPRSDAKAQTTPRATKPATLHAPSDTSNDTAGGSETDARLEGKLPSKSELSGVERLLLHRDTKAEETEPTPPHHTDNDPNRSVSREPIQRSTRQQAPARSRSSKEEKRQSESNHRKSRPRHILTTLASPPLRRKPTT